MTTLGVVAGTSSSPREPATVTNIAEDNVRRVVKALLAAQDDVTAVEVGEYIGVGKGAIYNRLKGAKPFTVGEVAALSRLFGVPVDVFFAGPAAMFRSIPEAVAGGREAVGGNLPEAPTRARGGMTYWVNTEVDDKVTSYVKLYASDVRDPRIRPRLYLVGGDDERSQHQGAAA
jgi:hypothetical protein